MVAIDATSSKRSDVLCALRLCYYLKEKGLC